MNSYFTAFAAAPTQRGQTISVKGFIIMFSFFVTVAEGAEGPSSGFEVVGRELAELDEGRSQEAMDNFFA